MHITFYFTSVQYNKITYISESELAWYFCHLILYLKLYAQYVGRCEVCACTCMCIGEARGRETLCDVLWVVKQFSL